MAAQTPNQLATNAACFGFLPKGDVLPALIYVFNRLSGLNLTIGQLMANSACYKAIPAGDRLAALIYLFNSIGGGIVPTPAAPCVNLIPSGAVYTNGGGYLLSGLTVGGIYSLTKGTNEFSAANGINPGCGALLNNGQFVCCDGNVLLEGNQPALLITATICAV